MSEFSLVEPNAKRILVVDGTSRNRRRVALQLTQAGYAVVTAESACEAVSMIRHHGAPRLAIIDTTLPDRQGMALAKTLHTQGASPVLLMSTPRALVECDAADKAALPDNHMESTLLRPYVPAALLNAVQQLIRSTEVHTITDTEAAIDADLRVNFVQRYLVRDGEKIRLTPTENRLLHILYLNRGRAVSPEYLVSHVWSGKPPGTLGSLWVHVRRLRNKLERDPDSPDVLVTVRGHGYALRYSALNLN